MIAVGRGLQPNVWGGFWSNFGCAVVGLVIGSAWVIARCCHRQGALEAGAVRRRMGDLLSPQAVQRGSCSA